MGRYESIATPTFESAGVADRGRLTVLSQNVVDRIQQPVDDHVRKNEHRDAG